MKNESRLEPRYVSHDVSPRRRRLGVAYLLAAAVLTVGLAACTPPSDDGNPPPPPPPPGGEIRFETVISGLDTPVALTNAGDERLFIAERGGAVRVAQGGDLLPEPFLDLTAEVDLESIPPAQRGERGLLGIAFPPDHDESGLFYVYYTNSEGNSVLARYAVDATNPNVADVSTAEELEVLINTTAYHNGGQLGFGPDGYLYWAVGEGQTNPNNAQTLANLRGKIMRIDVSEAPGYTIPDDNPFVGVAGARGEIWAYGLRNPWRFSFDYETGELYIADVGEDDYEEVNVAPAGVGGQNYGWPIMEGPECVSGPGCSTTGLTLPTYSYSHPDDPEGGASITGGYVYRGPSAPDLVGQYVFGDFMQTSISAADMNGDWDITVLNPGPWRTASFGVGADNRLYVTDYGGGLVYEITQEEE